MRTTLITLLLATILFAGCKKEDSKVLYVEMEKPEVVDGPFSIGVSDITDSNNQVFLETSETSELVYFEGDVTVGNRIRVVAYNGITDYNTWCIVEIDGKRLINMKMKTGYTNEVFIDIE